MTARISAHASDNRVRRARIRMNVGGRARQLTSPLVAPVDVAGNPLGLLTVHAHPDDEASKGAATVARYAAEGISTSLVCCTGGEEGDVLNPEADTPEVRSNLGAIRI